jgi:hypothetical protein
MPNSAVKPRHPNQTPPAVTNGGARVCEVTRVA